MAAHDAMTRLLRDALAPYDEAISEKRMMGGVCFFHKGNMLGGADRAPSGAGRLMFRIGKAREAEALARAGTSPVILGGRRMGGMVFLEEAACGQGAADHFVRMALDFVSQLPDK